MFKIDTESKVLAICILILTLYVVYRLISVISANS